MNEWKGDSKYADIVEKEMFNGIISGVSLDGTQFFYTNPLASRGDHHRFTWHECPCCPTNLARFIPSIGSYIYATSDDAIWVNQYIGNEAEFEADGRDVKVRIETDYPWEGVVTLTLMSAYKGQLREVDNDVDFDQVSISENSRFEATFNKDLLGGIVSIAYESDDNQLLFIPYYSWDNREPGEMKVWIPLT